MGSELSKVETRPQCFGLIGLPTLRAAGDLRLCASPSGPLWLLPPWEYGLGKAECLSLQAGKPEFESRLCHFPAGEDAKHPPSSTVPEVDPEADTCALQLLGCRSSQGEALACDQGEGGEC